MKKLNKYNKYADYNTTGAAYGGIVKECHTGPLDVMEIGGAVIWAGRWADMDDDMTWTLRVRFNDNKWASQSGGALLTANTEAKTLFNGHPELFNVKYPPTIDIDWPDYGVPALNKEWWDGLVVALGDLPPESHVAFYCQGGHGRTGTALSILASLSGVVPNGGDPVEWVREHYCEEVVESWAQVDYINKITGELSQSIPTSILKGNRQKGADFPTWTQDASGKWTADWTNTTTASTVMGTGVVTAGKAEVKALAVGVKA